MSVGCTRLLLASGSAPDRFLFLPSRTLPCAGPPGDPHLLYGPSGLPITFVSARSAICFLHNRLDLRQLASSLAGAQPCRGVSAIQAPMWDRQKSLPSPMIRWETML